MNIPLSSQEVRNTMDIFSGELKKQEYTHPETKEIVQSVDTLPLNEMGTEKWKDFEGGLYPNGENIRPEEHNIAGIEIGNSIVPLDNSGNEDENGKIVLLSIGMSNCTNEFSVFKLIADTFQLKNSKLIIVDGAQGGQTASIIKDPKANFWTVVEQRLQQQNVTANQVQAVWLKEANARPTDAFPLHAQTLKDELKTIVQILKDKYTNIKIAYLSSRTYGGYATTNLNPEPFAYETGFSVKWLIEEQINGDTNLTYSGDSPKAPWLSWGPYLWAKGTTVRSDGLFWLREDFVQDGTHPSTSGRLKVAKLLLDFLVNDETSKSWFLEPEVSVEDMIPQDNIIRIFPNPASDHIEINVGSRHGVSLQNDIKIYNSLGQIVITVEQTPSSVQRIDVSELPKGMYYLQLENRCTKFVKI